MGRTAGADVMCPSSPLASSSRFRAPVAMIWTGLRPKLLHLMRMLRRRPASVVLASSGWTAFTVLSAVPDAVCVDGGICLNRSSYWTMSLLLGALLLMANEVAPDLTMLGFTVLLVLSEVISDEDAWSGFSSTSVLSIGALFVVARALEETRAVEMILTPILGQPRGQPWGWRTNSSAQQADGVAPRLSLNKRPAS